MKHNKSFHLHESKNFFFRISILYFLWQSTAIIIIIIIINRQDNSRTRRQEIFHAINESRPMTIIVLHHLPVAVTRRATTHCICSISVNHADSNSLIDHKMSAPLHRWEWCDGTETKPRWIAYDETVCRLLDRALDAGVPSVRPTKGYYEMNPFYQINVQTMMQVSDGLPMDCHSSYQYYPHQDYVSSSS
jgi:hypothetical protein